MSRLAVFASIVVFASAAPAFADGKAFAPRAFAVPHMPDQAALVHHAGGVQYMAIETNIVGDGTDFAWIVPTPSPAEVEPVTTGTFPQLRFETAPRVVHSPPALWALMFVVFVLTLLVAAGRGVTALAILFLLFCWSILLPSLSSPRGSNLSAPGVAVHERRIVGSYEIVTLSADSAVKLTAWLNDHGFAVPSDASLAIDAYIAEGWSFTAARLRRDTTKNARFTPHPLGLRFASERCIYPVRLTGPGNGDLTVDLYVFAADGAASAARFDRLRCITKFQTYHRELNRIVPTDMTLTHLRGTLTEAQMTKDVVVTFERPVEYVRTRYSERGAAIFALNVLSVMVFCVAMLGFTIVEGRHIRVRHRGWVLLAFAVSFASAGVVFAALPKIPSVSVEYRFRFDSEYLYDIEQAIEKHLLHRESADRITVDELRTLVGEMIEGRRPELYTPYHDSDLKNPYSGTRVHEEDSPGNYSIRVDDGELVIVGHHDHGYENVFWVYPRSQNVDPLE